jgi:hypothetical protein
MMKIMLFHRHQISLVLIVIGITMTMMAQGQELVMKCSLDTCSSFSASTVIDGCTMIVSSDGSSQAFTFDPMAEDPLCALKTYSDGNCTSMISCTSYDVSDKRVVCNSPGELINPCGTDIDYKIEEASAGGNDDEVSSAMMTTTASLISAMMMMLWSLLW